MFSSDGGTSSSRMILARLWLNRDVVFSRPVIDGSVMSCYACTVMMHVMMHRKEEL